MAFPQATKGPLENHKSRRWTELTSVPQFGIVKHVVVAVEYWLICGILWSAGLDYFHHFGEGGWIVKWRVSWTRHGIAGVH